MAVIEQESLPRVEYLIMETLAARQRLGESHWTFPIRFTAALGSLAERGLVVRKAATIDGFEVAWLTDAGRECCLSATYKTPGSPPVAPGPDRALCIHCRHCGEHIERCGCQPCEYAGWRHAASDNHGCDGELRTSGEPGASQCAHCCQHIERIAALATMLHDIEGHIERRAAEIAGPMVETARQEARRQVQGAAKEVQRKDDLIAELRRVIKVRDKQLDQAGRERHRAGERMQESALATIGILLGKLGGTAVITDAEMTAFDSVVSEAPGADGFSRILTVAAFRRTEPAATPAMDGT